MTTPLPTDLRLADLRRFVDLASFASGTWSCAVCGGVHDSRWSWVIRARPRSGEAFDVIVCPSCAVDLEPQIEPRRVRAS